MTSRWNGPISLSLFTPGSDYFETLKMVSYYRSCVKESELIRNYVSFHFVTPTKHIYTEGILSSENATEYVANCSMVVPDFHNNIKTYRYKEKPISCIDQNYYNLPIPIEKEKGLHIQ